MTDEQASPRERRVARAATNRWPLVSAVAAVLVVATMATLIALRPTEPFAFDVEWMDEIVESRSLWLGVPALVMDFLGGGFVGVFLVPLGTAAVLLLFRRPWAATFFLVASVVSALAVQLIKNLVGRERPLDMLVAADFGSFPSGHVANAATIAMVLSILFPRLWVWLAAVAYTVLMMLSRTYLGAHWISDTVGGLLLGAGVAAMVWAPFATRLVAERDRPHPFVLSRGKSR